MAKGFGSRTSRIKTPAMEYECRGGPYHGKMLRLTSGGTLAFRVGNSSRGRYVAALNSFGYGKLQWEPIPTKVPCPCCGTIVDEEKVNE